MGNFENELKDMFDGVEFQPSERVWAGVESALAQKKKKRIFFMWQTYGVAAAIGLFITAGVLFNNGFFSNQEDPSKGTQLTEKSGEEKISTDSLNREDGLNEQLLAKEGRGANEEPLAKANVPEEHKRLMASATADEANGVLNSVITTSKDAEFFTDQGQTLSDALMDKGASEGLLIDSEMALNIDMSQPKPFQTSIAAAKAKWLLGLGVDESAMEGMLNRMPDLELNTFVAETMINGRLGSNNFNISSGGGSVPTNSIGISSGDVGNFLSAEAADRQFSANGYILNLEEQALGSLSAGGGFSIELSRKLQLNTSLRYSELRIKSSSNAYYVEGGESYPIYLPLGFDADNVNFVGAYNLTNTMQGLSLQPTLSYKVVRFGKFDVSVLAGVGFDYFFSYRVKGDLNFLSVLKANLNDSDFIRKFNLSGISGLGVNYRINDQFGLGVDLNYRYFVPTGATDGRRQSSVLGFGLGVNYFLNRKE